MDKKRLLSKISRYDGKPLTLMEVCGSHTAASARFTIGTAIVATVVTQARQCDGGEQGIVCQGTSTQMGQAITQLDV